MVTTGILGQRKTREARNTLLQVVVFYNTLSAGVVIYNTLLVGVFLFPELNAGEHVADGLRAQA